MYAKVLQSRSKQAYSSLQEQDFLRGAGTGSSGDGGSAVSGGILCERLGGISISS